MQAAGEIERTVGGADRKLRLGGFARPKHGRGVVPHRPAAGLRVQVHHRAPAAGNRQQVAIEPPRAALYGVGIGVQTHDADRIQALAAARIDDDATVDDLDPGAAHGGGQLARRLRAQVDHRGDVDAGGLQVERALVGAVVVGGDHGAAAGADGVTMDIGRDRRRQHDARAVVVGEQQRPLAGAGGEHHAARAHLPQLFAGGAALGRGQVIGEPLADGQEIVVVVAEHGAARQQRDLGQRGELGERGGNPRRGVGAVDARGPGQGLAAELGLLVGEYHPRAGAPRHQRRGDPRDAAAGDQHIAVRVAMLVAIGVGVARGDAEARGLADKMLVFHPHRARPHEGLVIKTGRHQAGEAAVDRQQVEIDRRPAVDAGGL